MIFEAADGQTYRIPGKLTPFQQAQYLRLIGWKWRHITTEPGRALGLEYDAILPESYQDGKRPPHLYPGIVEKLACHRQRNRFRLHQHFFHMASSQAAAINLFLPLLVHPQADAVFRCVRPDFASLATDCLDGGFCIEFWGEVGQPETASPGNSGPLADKSAMAGTDADIAIAYRNHDGELCLWLIEHKLTEKGFTECGGFKSRGRQARHDCTRSFANLVDDPAACYYHDVRKFRYWEITRHNKVFFAQTDSDAECPFQGGMNQLWRNQLLGLAIEQDPSQPFRRAIFSVVKHPENSALDATLNRYRALVGDTPKFSVFGSNQFVEAAEALGDAELQTWAAWYRVLYFA